MRDQIIQQYKDLAPSVDYLETREDIQHEKLACAGFSMGAIYGPIMTALDKRFKASVLISGGFWRPAAPEVHSLHFAPRSTTPTLMLNGRDDFEFFMETSQIPMLRPLGAPEKDKRHVVCDNSGHMAPRVDMIRETLDRNGTSSWLSPLEGAPGDLASDEGLPRRGGCPLMDDERTLPFQHPGLDDALTFRTSPSEPSKNSQQFALAALPVVVRGSLIRRWMKPRTLPGYVALYGNFAWRGREHHI